MIGVRVLILMLIVLTIGAGVIFYLPLVPTLTPVSSPVQTGGCKITGCSGQICSDQDVITTCEFKAEYGCYGSARCERQADGQCGWTQTEELELCLLRLKK